MLAARRCNAAAARTRPPTEHGACGGNAGVWVPFCPIEKQVPFAARGRTGAGAGGGKLPWVVPAQVGWKGTRKALFVALLELAVLASSGGGVAFFLG